MEKHVPNFLAAVWGFALFAVLVALSSLVRPSRKVKPDERARKPSEGSERAAIRLSPRYQVLLVIAAILFFGLLTLYPAVATFRQWLNEGRGEDALILIGVFLGTLSVALGYAWMRGDLSWSGDKEDHGHSRKRIS